MKALICELCGGNELIKEDGLFRCMHCGTRYTLEEARGLFADQPVYVEGIASTANLLQRAKEFLAKEKPDQAQEYCNRVLDIDAGNAEAKSIFAKADKIVDKPNVIVRIKPDKDSFDSANLFIDGEYFERVTTEEALVLQLTVGKYKIGVSEKEFGWLNVKNRHERFAVELKKRSLLASTIEINRLKDDEAID